MPKINEINFLKTQNQRGRKITTAEKRTSVNVKIWRVDLDRLLSHFNNTNHGETSRLTEVGESTAAVNFFYSQVQISIYAVREREHIPQFNISSIDSPVVWHRIHFIA